MNVNLTEAVWEKQNCSIQSNGIIVENGAAHAPHSVHREVKDTIAEAATQAVFQVVLRPLQRTKCWVGARANNKFYMASFDLAANSTLGAGNFVSHHSLIDRGDGTFECRVRFDGGFPDENPVFAIGALKEDQNEDYDGVSGLKALEVLALFFAEGTEFKPDLDISEGTSLTRDTLSFVRSRSQPLRLSAGNFDTAGFTAESLIKPSLVGNDKTIIKQWGEAGDERSWRLFLTNQSEPAVELSKNGATVAKRYESAVSIDEDETSLLSFTWDGHDLHMFINDERIGDAFLRRVLDEPIDGALHAADCDIEALHSPNGFPFKHWLWDTPRTLTEIAEDARALQLKGMPRKEPVVVRDEGDFPKTLPAMIQWLRDRGVPAENIRFVDNQNGDDRKDGRSTDTPWRSIQKAANELKANMAVIVRGRGGRFYEQVTPKASGEAGRRIWFVGDPEHPPILDSSELFDAPWRSMGQNRWRAPYNKNRKYSREHAYHTNCTGGACRHESVWMSHQLIYQDKQLKRVSLATVPANLKEGECYFERGSGSYDQPQFVWCRLPGNADPNEKSMRIGSAKKYLFDWSPHDWESFPGGSEGRQAAGRNHLGLVNLHFRFGATIRKLGPLNIRGNGWHVEHCSFSEGNTYGFSISGNNHTIVDCKVINSGQGIFRAAYLQNGSGKTRFERCLFLGGNLHRYPEAWEAGQKFTFCGRGGRTEIVECYFRDIHGPGLWWDLFNGDKNKRSASYLVQRCIFERCARNAVFFEHNTYNITLEHCGIWNTLRSVEGKFSQELAAAVRSQGAGHNTVRNNAIVFNEGKGHYFKAHDTRGDNNNDTIVDNVYINNGRADVDLERCEFYGGDEPSHSPLPNRKWSTSRIQGNVFFSETAAKYFVRDRRNGRDSSNDIGVLQNWTGGSNNVKAPNAQAVIEDFRDSKAFWKTRNGFSSKGPQNLVHFDDLPGTGWEVPK